MIAQTGGSVAAANNAEVGIAAPVSRLLLIRSTMPLIGNKVAEKDLRDWLQKNGYFGRSATIEDLELIAVRRPGWEQVFRFRARAKRQDRDEWDDLRGLIRDDERHGTTVRLTRDEAEFDALLAEWADGLIMLRTRTRGTFEIALILLAVVILALVAGVAVLKGA